ncbi:MAG: universal stress protein [Ktedonobacteraceae bacterium]
MFQRILVPLDGSPRAESALPVAAHIARATGGSLLLVQVIRQPIDYSGGLAPVPLLTDQVIESEMGMVKDYLKKVAASTELAGIAIRTDVSFGPPAQYLIEVIKAENIDLVVICSHGRTGFTRWALGSVAHTLVHQSTAPVLVLRQPDAGSPLKTGQALRALVPLDGSELAETALSPAAHLIAALAAPAQGGLHLAQVVRDVPARADERLVLAHEEALQSAKTYLAATVERWQATAKDLHLALTASVEGDHDVASALVNLAEREAAGGCDLIALSTHGRGGLERWVMGSVTDRILNTTKLPMFVVRPPKQRSTTR